MEYITFAAIKVGENVHHGFSHMTILANFDDDEIYTCGFVTNLGRFLQREEAHSLMQCYKKRKTLVKGVLHSEDLN